MRLTVLTLILAAATPQDEAVRLVSEGQYGKARQLVTNLIGQAANPASGAGVPYRAALYQLLGTVENTLGRHAEAQQALEEGIKLCEHHQPAVPELLVSLQVSLAESHVVRADFQEANRVLNRALATATKGLPPDHPRLASVLDGFGVLYVARGEFSRAEKFLRRALAILEKRLGPGHPDTATEALALASLLLSTNRSAEAVRLTERSLLALEQVHGKSHPRTVLAGYNLGVAKLKSNPAEAERVLRAWLAAWRESQPELHSTTANFLSALAAATLAQGDTSEAITLNDRALAILRQLLGPEHPQVVNVMYDRARLLKAAKRGKEAAAVKKEADRIRHDKGYPEPGRHSIDINALRAR